MPTIDRLKTVGPTFGCFDPYAIAPIAADSLMTNLTIYVEVAAATGLLIFVARSMLVPQKTTGRH